ACGNGGLCVDGAGGFVDGVDGVEEAGAAGRLGVVGEVVGHAAVVVEGGVGVAGAKGVVEIDGAASRITVEIALDEQRALDGTVRAAAGDTDVHPPEGPLFVAWRRM